MIAMIFALLSPRREVGEFKKRYKWMALVVILAFSVLILRLVQLSVAQRGKWSQIATENITKTINLAATRGLIRDSRGRIIATNRPSYSVYITPQILKEGHLEKIIDLMQLSPDEAEALVTKVANVPARRRLHQVRMYSDITRDQLAALSTHERDIPALDIVARPIRNYPYDHLGAHAVGYLNEVSAEDLEKHEGEGYRAGDTIGRVGLEKAWEGYLRGRRGFKRVLVDAQGRRQHDKKNKHTDPKRFRDATPGRDLVLTLDMELMRTIDRAFSGHPAGSVVVVDVNTGRVRALFSKPTYNLNDLSGRLSVKQYRELRDNPFRPLIDKTVYESYFPGSTFKPVSALTALKNYNIDPAGRVECIGHYEIGRRQRMRCTSKHGEVDLRSALVQSCNVYFWRLAEKFGLEELNEVAKDLGLGERTGIGINTEARGFLASKDWYKKHFGRFRLGYTLNTAIGQGNTRTTLLQLALMYGAFANGGTLYAPQIVEEIQDPNGQVIESFSPQVRRKVALKSEHIALVTDGMRGVVNDPNGTAFSARIEHGVEVAGKTGTAEITPGAWRRRRIDPGRRWYFNRSHAWFAGYAPASDPEVAIVVLVEHGGAGGKAAAPVGIKVLQEYLGAKRGTASLSPTLRRGGR